MTPYDPRQTFKAAWILSQLVFEEPFWCRANSPEGLKEWFKRKKKSPYLDDFTSSCVPITLNSAFLTTGGIALHVVASSPVYMETPWGEWYCWKKKPGEFSIETAYTFIASLDVDWENRWADPRVKADFDRGYVRMECFLPLRSVRGIPLPTYDYRRANNKETREEWVNLCDEAGPPAIAPIFAYEYLKKEPPKNHPALTRAS